MKLLRNLLDSQAKIFEPGGKLEKLYPVYEAHDTLLFTPGSVTRGAIHVRDALDLKRMMITVVVALIPVMLVAIYNTGYQANYAISQGAEPLPDWHTIIFTTLGGQFDPSSFLACVALGALYYLPVLIATFATGGLIELGSAIIRREDVNEGFLVTGMLIPLTLPPTIPLWQVVLGTTFGIWIGKEIFGGTGMNFLNPALLARAFLFFAYPADISGTQPWIAADFMGVDNFTGATWLAQAGSLTATNNSDPRTATASIRSARRGPTISDHWLTGQPPPSIMSKASTPVVMRGSFSEMRLPFTITSSPNFLLTELTISSIVSSVVDT